MSDEIDLADIDPLLGDDGADEPMSVAELDEAAHASSSSASSPATASTPASRQSDRHQHAQPRPASRQSASSPRSSTSSSTRRSSRVPSSSSSCVSASVSAALPLLLSASVCVSLLASSSLSSSSLAGSPASSRRTALSALVSSSTSSGSSSRSVSSSRSTTASLVSGSSGGGVQRELAYDDKQSAVHKPYFVSEADWTDGGVQADSVTQLLQLARQHGDGEADEERYDFHYRLRRHAIALLAAQKASCARGVADMPIGGSDASPASPTASLSSLLLSVLSSSSSSSSFLSTFEQLMSSQSPFSLRLSPTEQRYYDTIVELLSSSAHMSDGRVVESLLRYWLGLGDMSHSLQAVNFLLSVHTDTSASSSSPALTLSPSLTSFLHEWSSRLADMRSPVIRLGRTKHLTAIPSSTRRVSLFTSASASLSHNKSKRPHCGRKWDCEDDNGWERFDDRTSALLEAAYQQGRPYIDYTVEGKPHTYRADFQRMVQRNLQTGREKPLRTLLALLIREKSGRITQTVEINMPHSTSIRELRKELAQYLKHDEKQLRMMYANRVLRRIDYAHITIRDGIVPLGAEPLMVTKINKGDLEELCTFVLTGAEEVRQECWECVTCDFVDGRSFCSICAQVCHKGHVVRLLASSTPSFCHCGAGAGGYEAPCQALEESPGDREPTHPPSMCVSACGQFVYTLSSDMGLVKLGTGGGAGDSCTGGLYAQNTLMCVHAGGCLVEAVGRLLLRSPMVREDVLLAIDPHTLLFTNERVVLGSRVVDVQDDDRAALASWLTQTPTVDDPAFLFSTSWTLEYNHNKLDVDDVEDATSKDSTTSPATASDEATWTALSPYFLLRIKQALLTNPSYGQLISSSASPPSALSPEVPSLSIEEEGLFLRLPSKLGMKRCRVRIKHREHVMPVYAHDGSLIALNLVGLGEGRSQRRQRPARGEAREGEQLREEKEERKEDDEQKKQEVVSVMPMQEKPTRKKSRVQSIVVNSRVSGTDNSRKDREREEKERERERDSERERGRQSASIPPLIALTPYRKSRKRQQSMLLDVYTLPVFPGSNSASSLSPSSAVCLPVCSLCGHLPVSRSSSGTAGTVDPLSLSGVSHSSLVCPLCDHYSQPVGDSDSDLLIVLDDSAQKQLAELKEADRRKEDDDRLRRRQKGDEQLTQLTVKGGRGSIADSSADVSTESSSVNASSPIPISRLYADRLESLGFSPLRVQKALVYTRNSSMELALQWLIANAEQPDIDAPWVRTKLEPSLLTPPPSSSSPAQLSSAPPHTAFVDVFFLHCAHEACTPLDCVVDKYRAIKPTSAPIGKDAKLAAAALLPAATCDGCGVSSAVTSGRSTRPLLMCSHRDCKDMYLCDHCALMSNWQHSPHQHTHNMERSIVHSARQQAERDDARLTLGEFSLYLDSAHQQLAVIKQRDTSRKESVDLFDIAFALQGRDDDAARCVARDVYVNTRGDAFVHDSVNKCVWAMSLSSGRLERWLAAPLVSPSPLPTWDDITPADAAASILHHLSCVATSPAVIAASLQRTFAALQTIFASSSLQNEEVAVDALSLLHSCLTRWQQHAIAAIEPHRLDVEQATSHATAGVDMNALIVSIRAFVEQNVLQLSRLPSLALSPTSLATKQPASSQQPSIPQLIRDKACSILVDGFELFYPTWRQRLSRTHSLLFTAAASQISSHILQLLSAHYQAIHLGLLVPSSPFSAVVDLSLLSSHTQSTITRLLDDVADADAENVSPSVQRWHRSPDVSHGGRRSSQHVGTYVVLAYQSELLRLLAEVEGHLAAFHADTSDKRSGGPSSEHDAAGREGSPDDAAEADLRSVSSSYEYRDERARLQRRSKQTNSAYIRLCHTGFVKSQLLLARYEDEINKAAATSNDSSDGAKAERAEMVLTLFSQTSIGLLLPWLILSLPDLQVGKVQSADLSSLLSSVISLLCKLSSLSAAALSATRPIADKPSQLRLTNIRAKIAQLRQSQQLLATDPALSALSSSTSASSSSSPGSSAASAAFKKKRKPAAMRLHPFAVEVFTLIFHEFATPSSFSATGVLAMNKQNFCLYLKRKSSVSTEQAMSRTAAVFSKYGVPPSAPLMEGVLALSSVSPPSTSSPAATAASSVVFRVSDVGNEPSHLLLDGFLTYQSDLAVESVPRVLKELRFLESRHTFCNTHHSALMLLPDLKVALAVVLHALFAPTHPASAGGAGTPQSVAQGLVARSLEDQINVRPGVPAAFSSDDSSGQKGGDSAAFNVLDSSAVMKLMNSHDRWRQLPRRREKLLFLLAFVEHRAITIPSHFPSVGSFALLPRDDDMGSSTGKADDAFSDVHSTARLSELFQRCMREMGGGYGHYALTASASSATSALAPHIDSFYTEKAYAAAVIKHNQLTDACIQYARSLDLFRLLANAATKGTRCMYQSSTPDWWRRVVQSVMDAVRNPLSAMIRERREREEELRKADRDEKALTDYEKSKRQKDAEAELLNVVRRTQSRQQPREAGSRQTASSSPRGGTHSRNNIDGDEVRLENIEQNERERERAEQSAKAGQDTSASASSSNTPSPSIPSLSLSPSSALDLEAPLSIDSPLDTVQSPVLGPSLGGLELDDLDPPGDALDPAVMRAMLLMASNAMFLVFDLNNTRPAVSGVGGALSSQSSPFGSRAGSNFSSPQPRQRRLPESQMRMVVDDADITSSTQTTGSEQRERQRAAVVTFEQSDSDTDDDGEAGDEEEEREVEQSARDRALDLKRTQSDRFGSPMRLSASSSPQGVPALVTASSQSPSIYARISLSPPPLLMSAYGRRASESDASVNTSLTSDVDSSEQQTRESSLSFSATTSVLPAASSSPMRDASALSSWTGASLDPIYSAHSLLSPVDPSVYCPPASAFDDIWLAKLVHCPVSLTSSLSSSISSLQTALQSRVNLLHLLNSTFRAGHTQQLVDDVLSLIHQARVIADIQTSSSVRSRASGVDDGLLFFYKHLGQTLNKQRFVHGDRAAWLRLRCILLFFSAEFSSDDVDIILGSGMLSVLARFIQRADRALTHTQHQSLPTSISAPTRERAVSASEATCSAAVFDDDERAAMFKYRTWAWQVFLYLTTFLLSQPHSAKSKHHRYLLASTVGQQLTLQLHAAIARIRRYAETDGLKEDEEYDSNRRAKAQLSDFTSALPDDSSRMCAFDTLTFPLQHHNPLYSLGTAIEELVYRSVDMLNVLTQLAMQHSVCSTDTVVFLIRALRSSSPSASFCPLPSILQLAVVRLLRNELPFHAPHTSMGGEEGRVGSTSTVRLEDELMETMAEMALEAHIVAGTHKEKRDRERRKREDDKKSDRRERSAELREEKESSGGVRDRGRDREPPSRDKERSEGKERVAADTPSAASRSSSRGSSSIGSSTHGGTTLSFRFATDASTSPLASPSSNPSGSPPASSLDMSSLPAPNSPKEARKSSAFRRIAAAICSQCRYIEFLACPYHKCYLTREMSVSSGRGRQVTVAACGEADCDVSSLTCSTWHSCRHCQCSSPSPSVVFYHMSEGEASYCADAIRCNAQPVIRHNLFFCTRCRVAEFPGTKNGGLTLNIEGYLYDLPTHRFLLPSAYKFTHLPASNKCNGEIELVSVKLSREEAMYLGKLIKRTQAMDASKAYEVEHFTLPQPALTSGTAAAGQPSVASDLSSLPDAWGYTSWHVSASARSALIAEMLSVIRLLLTAGRRQPTDDPLLSSGNPIPAHSSSFSVQISPSHSRATSISTSHSPRPDRRRDGGAPPIRVQWRDALHMKLRGSLLMTTQVCDSLAAPHHSVATSASTSSVAVSSYVSSLLALVILGGHSDRLYNGAHVSFRANGQLLRGVVRRYDPSMATASIAVNHGDTATSSRVQSSVAASDETTAGVTANAMGQTAAGGERQPHSHQLIEVALDELTPESEVPAPPLLGLALINDIVHVAQRCLTAKAEGKVNAYLLGRLQHALLTLLHTQLPTLSTSSSSLTAVPPLASLLQPLYLLAQSSFSHYPLNPQHYYHSLMSARDELYQRLTDLLQPATCSHAAFIAAVRPPRTEEANNSTTASSVTPSHPSQSQSHASTLTSIIPLHGTSSGSGGDDEPPLMPVIVSHLAQLTEMGFSSIAARYALAHSHGDVNVATNAILTDHIYEDGEIDENVAMERWEQILDRLNVRAEVDAWNAWQAQQQQHQYSTGSSLPAAADKSMDSTNGSAGSASGNERSGGGRGGSSVSGEKEKEKEGDGERERKLLSVASSVYMAHRFLWPVEEPEQPDPSALPLTTPPSASPVLSSLPHPYHNDVAFDRAHLLHLLLTNRLLHSRVVITEEAASVYNKPTVDKRKGYKVGDKLHIIDLVNKVCPAEVVEVNAAGTKIFIHYSGWSKKWDEWCEVDSKRIQPHYSIGDKLTVIDSVNKESEAVVMDVQVKDNQLKLFIHYVGWTEKWNEWISVGSKRIISRHSDKKDDKAADGSGSEGSKPVRCSFELIGKVATIIKVDAAMSSLLPHIASGRSEDVLSLSLTDDDSPLVLVHIVEPSLSVGVFLWMKLSLLRVARPRSAVSTTHYPVIPTPSSWFAPNRATFAAQAADVDAVLSIATTNQAICVAHTATRILNEYVEAASALQLSVRANIALLSAIPPSSLRSVTDYSHADSSHVLMGAAHDGKTRLVELTERVDRLAGVICAAMEREAERAREAKPPVVVSFTAASSTSSSSSRSSLSQPVPPPTPRSSPAPTSVFDSYCADIQKLIMELATSLPALAQSCRSFSLTHVSPSSSMEVRCDHVDVNLQLVSVMPLSDAEAKSDKNITASSSTASWCIHFYADEPRSVLLNEMIITIDPVTRMFPPFLVPNPVYITAAVVKGKAGKKSGKDALPDGQVTLSITPFTTHALESLYTVVDLLCLLRRSYSPSAPLSALPIAHVRKLESLMKLAANTLSDHLSRLHRVLPVPSNIKARGYECVAKLLAALAFSHVQMTAIVKREKERERMEIIDRERDRQREAALRDRRDARKQSVMEERKEADDDSRRVRDDGSSGSTYHGYTSPSAHPHPHSSLLRSASSSAPVSAPSSLPPSSPSSSSSTASSLPASWQSELIDLHWMPRIVLHEAKLRLAKEKPYSPLHSVYLQRLIELLVAALRYEKLVTNSKYWEVKLKAAHTIASSGRQRSADKDSEAGNKLLEIVRQPASNELVAVLSVERLLMLATDPRAHPPLASSTGEQRECECVWCKLLEDARDQTLMAMPLMDLSPRSMVHTFISDMDHYPDSIITGQLTMSASAPVSGDGASVPAAPPLSSVLAAATSAFAGSISSLSSMFGSGSPSHSAHSHIGGPSSAPAALPSPGPAMRSRSEEKSPVLYDNPQLLQHGERMMSPGGSSRATSLLATSLSLSSTTSNSATAASSLLWRDRLHIAERLLPSPNLRSRIFNLLLNSTAHPNHARPEIAFRRGSDQSGDDSSSSAAATSASTAATGSGARVDDDALLQRQSMFQQLCDAFVKGGFHRQAAPLRAEVSTVTWKTILAGALDQGAAGLPGPFRQALHEICAYLNATAANPLLTSRSLLIPCPNSRSQTGDDRNKLMVNPSLASESALIHYRVFGQLMGIAIRSKCALDLDLSECFWKQIVGQPLHASDLPSFDFTAARSLAFCDPVSEQPFKSEEWNEYLADLTYTTVASDNQTVLELIAGGAAIRVPYNERHTYRRLATHARLYEAALQISAIRGGLHSIIPEQAIELLSWQELELRVCGRPTVDLDTLKKHTVYSPSTYSLSSPIVQQFWQVLASFTPGELAAFLQFAWARSRLPSEMGSYRMQINILDKANSQSLPTAETCFFNVNLPKYDTVEVMTGKIKMALLCGTITS